MSRRFLATRCETTGEAPRHFPSFLMSRSVRGRRNFRHQRVYKTRTRREVNSISRKTVRRLLSARQRSAGKQTCPVSISWLIKVARIAIQGVRRRQTPEVSSPNAPVCASRFRFPREYIGSPAKSQRCGGTRMRF